MINLLSRRRKYDVLYEGFVGDEMADDVKKQMRREET